MIHKKSHQELRQGLQYIPRQTQPSMFELLSWKDKQNACDNKQWLKNYQKSPSTKITKENKYLKGVGENIECKEKIEYYQQSQREGKKEGQKQHKINHQLYFYGQAKKQDAKKLTKEPQKKQQVVKKISKNRLNPFKQSQKAQIQIRKNNIQKFSKLTRQLPNSAFTTYFGQPAFAHYGSGVNNKETSIKKSYNIMPHAGKNQPQNIQSQKNALEKAKIINSENRVPRRCFQNGIVNDEDEKNPSIRVNQYYQVEIQKPDLVNHVRFTSKDSSLHYKSKTPSHDDLNYLPKRNFSESKLIQLPRRKSPKKYQKKKMITSEGDGLAYMNRRQNFRGLLDEKKLKGSRLAYKVTECYPLDWEQGAEIVETDKEDKWNSIKIAGISTARSLDAKSLIYSGR